MLELGCGAGRVTRGLVRLVIAVDKSEDMLSQLAELPHIETVTSRLEDLELGRGLSNRCAFDTQSAGNHD